MVSSISISMLILLIVVLTYLVGNTIIHEIVDAIAIDGNLPPTSRDSKSVLFLAAGGFIFFLPVSIVIAIVLSIAITIAIAVNTIIWTFEKGIRIVWSTFLNMIESR